MDAGLAFVIGIGASAAVCFVLSRFGDKQADANRQPAETQSGEFV